MFKLLSAYYLAVRLKPLLFCYALGAFIALLFFGVPKTGEHSGAISSSRAKYIPQELLESKNRAKKSEYWT